jgi:hypothetical protein
MPTERPNAENAEQISDLDGLPNLEELDATHSEDDS